MPSQSPLFKLGKSYSIAFSPSGKLLATVSPIQVNIWDVGTKKKITSIRALKHPSAVAFSPDEALLAIKNTVGELCTADVITGDIRLKIREDVDDEGCSPVFTPDGHHIVDGSWDGVLSIYSLADGKCVYTREWPRHMINSIEYMPAIESYAVGVQPKTGAPEYSGENAFISLVTWPNAGSQRQIPLQRPNLWTACPSPDASKIAIVTGEGYRNDILEIIDASTGEVLSSFHDERILGESNLAWSPDGRYIAWPAEKKCMRIFDASCLRELWSLDVPYSCEGMFSPDGTLLAIGAWKDGLVLPLDKSSCHGETPGSRVTDPTKRA